MSRGFNQRVNKFKNTLQLKKLQFTWTTKSIIKHTLRFWKDSFTVTGSLGRAYEWIYLVIVLLFLGEDLLDVTLAFISVAVNFLFCDETMFEVLLCYYSLPVLIMSYFLDPNYKRTLIKGLDVQAIKMCLCSCIIIQPCALQSTPHSLDVLCSHHWAATFHKSNQTSFFLSTPKSVVVTEMTW